MLSSYGVLAPAISTSKLLVIDYTILEEIISQNKSGKGVIWMVLVGGERIWIG